MIWWTSSESPLASRGNVTGATRAYVSPLASAACAAGTYCVSICTVRAGSLGRLSSSRPASSGFTTDPWDQKYGVKNATGPLKLAVLRNSVQQLSPVGTSLPAVVGLP